MTETSSLYNTQPPSYRPSSTTIAASASPRPNGIHSDSNAQDEEEYTIKCVCIYTDDDGNTVYCPNCDTWQHIECYYHGKKVPEEHFCRDCDRGMHRDLDSKKATDRQRRAREHLESGDRKIKKPASKTSKKKQKDIVTTEQINGWINHERQDSVSAGRDQPPPAKKPKTSHRTSGSIVSLNGEPRKRANSNMQSYPSPSKSPQDIHRFSHVPQYSIEFLELYNQDEWQVQEQNQQTVAAVNQTKRWSADDSLVVKDTNQQPDKRTPFVSTQQNLDKITWPQVSLQTRQNLQVDVDGKHPTWKFLQLEEPISKDTLVGEIRGELGTLEEYCQQLSSTNRWAELWHPDPFVFFHPHMDIYIDSRANGTQFRFLRRSCNPNVTLKTFVNLGLEDAEERHCFVANQDIAAGTELTAAWFLTPSMFSMKPGGEDPEQLENRSCEWVSKVLANFGDCACDQTHCAFARLDRRTPIKAIAGQGKSSLNRKRKVKGKQAISPMSTGQATNSRAGSETINGTNEDDQDDHKSISESSRSDAHSRDITPVNPPSLDADPVLGADLTARELRKLQNIERLSLRNPKHAVIKKKKRTSGASTLNTPDANGAKHSDPPPVESDDQHSISTAPAITYKDNNNPATKRSQQALVRRPTYVSIGVQTSPPGISAEELARRKKAYRFISPQERMAMNVRKYNKWKEEEDKRLGFAPRPEESSYREWLEGMVKQGSNYARELLKTASKEAIKVTDSQDEKSKTPVDSVPSSALLDIQRPTIATPMPLPSQAAHTHSQFKPPPAPRLHLQTLPPVPVFSNGIVGTPGSVGGTSTMTTSAAIQSPPLLQSGLSNLSTSSSNTIAPSPIKKKLSLGDYMSRRNLVTTPTIEKTQSQALNGSPSDREQDSTKTSLPESSDTAEVTPAKLSSPPTTDNEDGRGITSITTNDIHMKDDDEEEYSPPDASPAPNEMPFNSSFVSQQGGLGSLPPSGKFAPEVANVLAQLAQFKHPTNKT